MPLRPFSQATALVLGVLFFCAPTTWSTSVNVALDAAFNTPPYLIELLETAAQENSSSYFPLLDRIADGRFADLGSEKELYHEFLQVLQEDCHISSPEALSTFQLALSLHEAAPRIEAHYQYYKTSVHSVLPKEQDASCPVWVHFNGKQYCSPTLERAQQDFAGPDETALPFDRSLEITTSIEIPVAILYADISSPLFGHYHRTLSESARAGQTLYRLRHRPLPKNERQTPLRVAGYGVELQLKRTDYVVIDDREANKADNVTSDVKQTTGKDVEDTSDLKPLSISELEGLGLKTSSYVLNSENPLDTLLQVSQDFPKYSSSLAQMNYSSEFVAEHEANREILLPEGYNVLWMNGLQIPWRQMDAFALLERLRQERALVNELQIAGLSAPEAISLMSHSAIFESRTNQEAKRYDWRDEIEGGKVIIWLNNIEKDSQYAEWPMHSSALLQRTFPGSMPSVRRDIHNIVVPLDLSTVTGAESVIDVLYQLVQRQVPVRFGFVPTVESSEAEQQARVTYHLWETYGIESVLMYIRGILETGKPTTVSEKHFTASVTGKEPLQNHDVLSLKEILASDELKATIDNCEQYLKRLAATGNDPPAFINGVPVVQDEQWMHSLSSRVSIDLQTIQQKVYTGSVSDETWLAGEFIKNAAEYRNPLIIPEDGDALELVSLAKVFLDHESKLRNVISIEADTSAGMAEWSHAFVVRGTDDVGEASLTDRIKTLKDRGQTVALGAEIHFIDNLDDKGDLVALIRDLGFEPGQTGIVINGRRVGPLSVEDALGIRDLEELFKYEKVQRVGPVADALSKLGLKEKVQSPRALAIISALVALSAAPDVSQGSYDGQSSIRMDLFNEWKDAYSSITVGDSTRAHVQIVGAIDPTSELAQRWIPMIRALANLNGVFVKLFLNPRGKLSELPIKRFYRYVLDSQPQFTEDGALFNANISFQALPRDALLNLGLDVPSAWFVSAKDSIYDLDNLKLSALKSGDVNAVYELESILIEGHSRDVTTGSAPRGVQLLLGTDDNPQSADTLIMANLGYFQFKANPGYWNIHLKPGRSAEIFEIDTLGSGDVRASELDTHVTLMTWQGKVILPRFSRKKGKEEEDVLTESGTAVPSTGSDFFQKARSFGQSILSKSGAGTVPRKHADINIFSVASGHLYERMLNIMMVSVMKNTKHSVKFWFIEQFLSPAFKSSIPHLATAYGFEYELVTYKWPHWLRSQKEKQREIWGYKILFLDVLFPLDLDKIIFVDSDQIVRADMYELVTHNLQGAPYGFTPMCDSRVEMEGFRFWKQGYWKNFLRGLPYHISALYVVDLKRFRAMAAGDRLRGQYHQLSADPASLSNLDQDLPNNMQMQLPIHSLPQEWLWCETWCSDESLKDAKTIDLCNNPLTKEPKLDRARRQVPEWTIYDDEITEVFQKTRSEAGQEDIGAIDSARVQEELDIQAKKDFDEKKKREKDEL